MTAPGLAGEIQAARAVVLARPSHVCTIRDGRFVEPCEGVLELVAVRLIDVLDPRTRQPLERRLWGLTASGMTPLRACPSCGVELVSRDGKGA